MTLVYEPIDLKRRQELRKRVQSDRRSYRLAYARPRSQARSIAVNKAEAKLKRDEVELAKFYARVARDQPGERINAAGLALIKEFESYFAKPYNDPVGYATVGYGHLIAYRRVTPKDNDSLWVPGQKNRGRLTEAEASLLLDRDLDSYEKAVRDALKRRVTANQFSACVSLCYNIGPGGFATSSVCRFTNLGMYGAAANSFKLWNKGGGVVLPGLTRRREEEAKLYRK